MPDFSQILMQAQQMQAEMERAQASLSEQEVTGTAGGGLVTAVVNGGGDLLRLSIDRSVVDPADVETLEDLVVAAVHDARRGAQDIANDAMGGVAGSLDLSSIGLSLPGFGPPADEDDEDDYDDEDEYDDDEDDELAGVTEIDVITVEVVPEDFDGSDGSDDEAPRPGPSGA
ncbi:MAG TPA: YbaB/EbfC family nucleoid-associated protein [Nakamurella sp.]